MSTTEEEVVITSPSYESEASDERDLEIDECVSGGSAVPSLQVVPDLNVVVREGEECVRRALKEVEGSDCGAEEASEGDIFVQHGQLGQRGWR